MKRLISCTKEKNTKRISVVGSEKTFKVKNWVSNRFPRLQLWVPSVRKPATSEVCLDGKVSLLRKHCCQRLTKEPTPFASFFSGRLFTVLHRNQFSSFYSNNKGCLFEDFNGMKIMVTLDKRIQREKECRFLALRIPQVYNDCLPMTHKQS